MRAFKIWNKARTSSFNLSGLNVITTNVAGLGNKFTNDLYDSRIKKHLISQTNSFEQINLTVNFGVHSNAYQKYREFMNFIQANGRNILVIEYYTPGASRFVDVVLSNASKNQKTGFGVLVETVSFDRLTPYYILQRRTGRSVLVSNRYLENVVPRLELKNNLYPTGTKIRVKSKNKGMPDLTGKTEVSSGVYRIYNYGGITVDYNIYNDYFIVNGVSTETNRVGLFPLNTTGIHNFTIFNINTNYTDSSIMIYIENPQELNLRIYRNESIKTKTQNVTTQHIARLLVLSNITFNNYIFRVEMEKAGNNLELDRPIEELKGYTLREVFEDNQRLLNNNFDDNTVWASQGGVTSTYSNGEVKIKNTDSYTGIYQPYMYIDNQQYYYIIRAKGDGRIQLNTANAGINEHTLNASYLTYSGIFIKSPTWLSYFGIANVQTGKTSYVDYVFLINQTDLGLSHLTKEQMDYWFNQYQTYKETPTEYSKPITATQEIELNESILSNQELIIDSENKTVTLNGANAYQITNKDKSTFLNLPEGDYLVECDTPITVEYKRWVID